MKYVISTAVMMIGLSGAASAGGMAEPTMEPAPAPVALAPIVASDWTGFYGGLHIATGDVDIAGNSVDADGLGLHAGYRYDLGSYVLGAEVDVTRLDIDTLPDDGTVARLKGVAGYDAGAFMPYVTAGIASLSIDTAADDLRDTGSFFGLGATYAASERVDLSVEYLEHQFDDYETLGDVDASTASVRVSFNF
ncbi:outer membrane beta-barrel protein [Loktanella sp. SALINAS62]|uniref:outer membrane protein n=1 Tax=Loktanella sp. SALINAS62 TaxID=2706124 RepID=UPI001B8D3613|nr:outer membrane beta-barrel protein [Loktanella sp. SALINAS62]MBS1303709.1 porin family protein [Loktanella sp. SALINAS62]